MLRNYFRIAFRTLVKNRIFSIINVFGLAVGLTCCLLIGAFLYDELNYDHYPAHAGELYRVGIKLNQNGGEANYPAVDVAVGAGMKNTYPEVLASTRIMPMGESYVQYKDKQFKESHMAFCDSNFLELFSIPLVEGDPKTALSSPNTVVITRAVARKYFGSEPALGKVLDIMKGSKVTGVIDQVPDGSHFHFDMFMSMVSIHGAATGTTWSNIGFYTYLLLDKKADPKKLEAAFPQLVEKYVVPESQHDMGVSLAEARKALNNWKFYLIPVTSIHLHSATKYEIEPNGDIQYIYIFGALAVFILLLACVNFTNLSTASSASRSREVGIRKVLGSVRIQLITQFLAESVLLTLAAMVLAYLFVYLLLPFFNGISGKHIQMAFFRGYGTVSASFILTLAVGFLAGMYPAFFLSSFRTIAVLKGSGGNMPAKKGGLRNALVIFQFMISTALIIGTLVVYQQLHYMQHKKLGYDKDQVLVIQDTWSLHKNQDPFKEQLLRDPRVVNVTISRDQPVDRVGTEVDGSEVYAKENKENESASEIHAFYFHVDYDYLNTLGMKMAAGRYFTKNFSGDSNAVVINESAVRDLGWTSNEAALNKTIVSSGLHQFQVIGVVRDFNYTSARQKIAPLLMMLGHNYGSIMVKVKTEDIPGFLSSAKKRWASYNVETPFSYYFLDDRFGSLYAAEQKMGKIFTLFALIAILIASLGLFGLVAFTTEQRTKEIGIRKVLGASVSQVLVLLSRKFLYLVLFAFVIAIPVTWWAMHVWLNNFAYRIMISWWVFPLAGAAALAIAGATVSFQAIRAAVANPVDSLRNE
jgi:putative ABC transport system permease protein